ncbi:MAG: DNA-3-methyladenine glycosylase [Chloroflexi bacterium]|nr:DNA-3-methyladenine glycosylase [Chloroflexota bacterium]
MALPADPASAARAWFDRPAVVVARELLGATLTHAGVGGRIVEVEAYSGPEDLAAHSSRGMTPRNRVMFGPPGHLYVYLIYGLHHCINVVTGPGTKPEAVLIRALEIEHGREAARQRRGANVPDRRLASGPGNVARALGIDRALDGTDLLDGPVHIEPRPGRSPRVARGPRIGVAYAGPWAERPMRFWIDGDPHVSRG